MKQILQSLKSGDTELAEVPAPQVAPGHVLIHSARTLVSAGTERMLVEFGKANWLDKARQQPDKVRMVLDKMRTAGIATTMDAVRHKLDQPLALGYCNAGVVAAVGDGVAGFEVGDRVASNGKHAEVVSVPANLCARIPDAVDFEPAAFTVAGAIGLQGIRLAQPTLGESVVVTGLGLIGLLTVQMLRAQGCRVLGIDLDPTRLALARQFGAETVNPAAGEDVLAAAQAFTAGRGVDAVLITASTRSNEPVHQAAEMCRQRGRIVLVGVVGLELSRADFYAKELSFQVSCSYGPGRYDPAYEEGGHDYPLGYVRWTEQRNFEAVLELLASGRLDVAPLISHRFKLPQAADAYALLAGDQPSLGIVLEYPGDNAAGLLEQRTIALSSTVDMAPGKASAAFIGAGNYAGRTLIPAFEAAGASLHSIVSEGGVSAMQQANKHGFLTASTDAASALDDPEVDTAVIATRHDTHAMYVLAALAAGKHVFCEKPLCLTLDELDEIYAALGVPTPAPASARAKLSPVSKARTAPMLMPGFNRRFAPHVVRIKQLLATVTEPVSFVMTVNAGAIPADHWTQDKAVGGGRIVGEGCHFIDLLRFLAGAPVNAWQAMAMGRNPALTIRDDKASITLAFADGSMGTIHYLANGHKDVPKERLEIFCGGRILQLDDFRRLRGYGWKGFSSMNLRHQDKGQKACAAAFVTAVKQGLPCPIALDEVLEVARASVEIQNHLAGSVPEQF